MNPHKLTPRESQAILSLSTIMSLRMIGLFMVIPVFSLYAYQLKGATPLLIGIAVGVYGLSQALFQIPFGSLSDRFGRKPIILVGLLIFIFGSLLAANAHSIAYLIIGRALQGVGAVGGTILAFIADLTRENQRTKAMALTGMSIGLAFSVAMVCGPLLTRWMAVNQLFIIASLFGFLAIVLLYTWVPTPTTLVWHRDMQPEKTSILTLLCMPELAKLNLGIFLLHAIFTASFVVIPISLYQIHHVPAAQQWLFYIPALVVAFGFTMASIQLAEKYKYVKTVFISAILLLVCAESLLWYATNATLTLCALALFFTGFSTLEAFLPSLISRTAPIANKGSALGIYSCAQFSGIFVGGIIGGWLYGAYHFVGVYSFCIFLALVWLFIAFLMQPPLSYVTYLMKIIPAEHAGIAAKLRCIPGIVEVTVIAEDGIAYLKMEKSATSHVDFIRLKEDIQFYT